MERQCHLSTRHYLWTNPGATCVVSSPIGRDASLLATGVTGGKAFGVKGSCPLKDIEVACIVTQIRALNEELFERR